jgi:hypothetical protein
MLEGELIRVKAVKYPNKSKFGLKSSEFTMLGSKNFWGIGQLWNFFFFR